jgi:rRNA maturation endonuclease Nob1
MKQSIFAHFCCQCLRTFHSPTDEPEKCSRCGSRSWDELKRYSGTGAHDDHA